MDREKAKRNSLRRAAVCGAVCLALAAAAFLWVDGMGVLAPLAAGAGTAALWALLVRFALCREDKYLDAGFRVPVRHSVCLPVWLALTLALLAGVMARNPVDSEALSFWLFSLFALGAMAAVPVAVLALGVLGLIQGVQHLRQTPESQGRLCRELPVVLPAFLLVLLIACGIVAIVYLQG